MYGVILYKDHPTLPLSELESVLGLGGASILSQQDNFVLVDKKFDWKRLALAKLVFRVQYSGKDPERAGEYVSPKGTFRVSVEKSTALERKIGKKIAGKVNLTKPDETYFGTNRDQFYFGIVVWARKSFESRKVQNRPYFHPTSLHPKYARVLVNLSGVKKGETLLDPFCGTGGILIEAALVGAKPVGRDVEKAAVRGSQDNLAFYKLEGDVRHGDARKLSEGRLTGKYDAIATDPPYGRASYFSGEKLQELYNESLKSIANVLKPGGRIALTVPDTITLNPPKSLTILEKHKQRVHKSLTRHFYVLMKSKPEA